MKVLWPNGKTTAPDLSDPFDPAGGHYGVDLKNFDINAATIGGVVAYAGWQTAGGGYVIEWNGDDGNYHRYLHNSAGLLVGVGNRIEAGTHLGIQSDTGYSFGKHLHYGIRKGGRYGSYIDPYSYIKQLIKDNLPTIVQSKEIDESEENNMDIRYVHRKEPTVEWMIVGQSLGAHPTDPKQKGYRVTLDVLTAQAWGAIYGVSSGDSWHGLTRDQYIRVQENARKIHEETTP